MIRSRKSMPVRPLEIDLSGPYGNAIHLVGLTAKYGRDLGYSEDRIKAIQKVMLMGDYEGLLKMFDREFGHFVTLWR